MKSITLFIVLSILVSLSGCSIFSDPKDVAARWTVQHLYSEAKGALEVGDYDAAIKYYEMLEARFPFGKYAQQAQLDVVYAYFKFEEPESAMIAANRFLKLYPRHPKADYVYYLKGLVNFKKNQGTLDRFLPIDRSQRDQSSTLQSFQDFAELAERFPKSRYSQDARQRMVHLRNRLAKYELHVAKYYLKRGAYLAAANRAKTVIESYQRTPVVADALVVLAKAYKIMNLPDLSANALKVLQLNYPKHEGIEKVTNLVLK